MLAKVDKVHDHIRLRSNTICINHILRLLAQEFMYISLLTKSVMDSVKSMEADQNLERYGQKRF